MLPARVVRPALLHNRTPLLEKATMRHAAAGVASRVGSVCKHLVTKDLGVLLAEEMMLALNSHWRRYVKKTGNEGDHRVQLNLFPLWTSHHPAQVHGQWSPEADSVTASFTP
jgi:hypothetical protein